MSASTRGTFELPDGEITWEGSAPRLLADAAAAAGVLLDVACGGNGTCGGCAVDLLSGRFRLAGGEEVVSAPDKPKRVLACQTTVLDGEFRVAVPRHSLVEGGEKIVMDFAHAPAFSLRPPVRAEHLKLSAPTLADQDGEVERVCEALGRRGYKGRIDTPLSVARSAETIAASGYDVTATVHGDGERWRLIRLAAGDGTGTQYGAAVDVGTTTVVVALVDLNAGQIVDAASCYNRQIVRCDNVASRISYASDTRRLEELRGLVVDSSVNRLLKLLADRHGLAAADIAHMTVSGNAVMTHLFCGLSPTSLGAVPFAPVSNFLGPYRAGQLGLAMNPEAVVDIAPSTAAYIGGDITSDMHVCGIGSASRPAVLIDIGTNAEIVVGNRDRMIACAAPAGPAFEGHGLTCGMRAAYGAIDSIRIDGPDAEAEFTVIGEGAPAGVCGSGLIDFVAQAYRAGLISMAGRFAPDAVESCPRIGKVRQGEAELLAYEIVPAERTDDGLRPILITERDIAALLQAKGVIFAATTIAMKHFGDGLEEVGRIYLAGGFAKHIDLDNAVAMGLLPDVDRDKYVFIGNGSLGGAFLALVDGKVRDQLPHLAAAPTVIELNLDPDFMDAYTMAMLLPAPAS